MFRIGKSIDRESRLAVAGVGGKEAWQMIANAYGIFFWGDENLLELSTSNDCTTL